MILKLMDFSRKAKGHLSFLELRKSVVDSNDYDPDSTEMDEAIELENIFDYQGAIDRLLKSGDNFVLSPRFHIHLSDLFNKISDEDGAYSEWILAISCLKGILSTGEGTENNPYLVLRISDEKDILDYLEYKPLTQKIIKKGNKHFDIFECENGNDCWFDISDFFK